MRQPTGGSPQHPEDAEWQDQTRLPWRLAWRLAYSGTSRATKVVSVLTASGATRNTRLRWPRLAR